MLLGGSGGSAYSDSDNNGHTKVMAPRIYYRLINRDAYAAEAAVILFTSGSEDTPKGVVLSHQSIQADRFHFFPLLIWRLMILFLMHYRHFIHLD